MSFLDKLKEQSRKKMEEQRRVATEVDKVRHVPSDELEKQANPGWLLAGTTKARAARVVLNMREKQGKK